MAVSARIKKQLKGFSLDVAFTNKDKRLGILGASGSGKSMTLRCLAGIGEPDEGRIELNGRVLYDSAARVCLKPQDRRVGYLFQNYALFPNMTVEENIAAGICGRPKEERAQVVREMMERFRLGGLEGRRPGELSGGQQQRVAFARIMAYQPELLLLDEPFSAMDSYLKDVLQQQLLEMLEEYEGDVIMVSHNRDEIFKLCQNTMILHEGRVEVTGDTLEIFRDPQTLEAARISGVKNLSPAERIDAHHLRALDWDLVIRCDREIGPEIRYVGFRAHDFIPCNEMPEENGFAVDIKTTAQLPFETHFYLRAGRDQLCWFISRDRAAKYREKGMPRYLKFPSNEKILLLKD